MGNMKDFYDFCGEFQKELIADFGFETAEEMLQDMPQAELQEMFQNSQSDFSNRILDCSSAQNLRSQG